MTHLGKSNKIQISEALGYHPKSNQDDFYMNSGSVVEELCSRSFFQIRWIFAGRLPDGDSPVLHTKVASHWSLSTLYSILCGFWSRQAGKYSNLEHTSYLFDCFR
jgi:hypothetical protein